MSAGLGRHEDFDAGSWGAARQEKMLMALRAKFNSYPDLAKQLRDNAGKPLAQASQGDCDHGIGLGVVDAKLGMTTSSPPWPRSSYATTNISSHSYQPHDLTLGSPYYMTTDYTSTTKMVFSH